MVRTKLNLLEKFYEGKENSQTKGILNFMFQASQKKKIVFQDLKMFLVARFKIIAK